MSPRLLLMARRVTKHAYRIRGLGVGRVCEAVRRYTARTWPGGEVLISDFMGTLRFSCDLREHMGSQIFWRGHYSGSQLKVLRRYLPEGGVFIDVGANQGEFSVYAASVVGEKGRVIAFEPLTRIRERLLSNIKSNGFTCVTVVPVAAGSDAKVVSIYTDPSDFVDGTHHDGLATLFRHHDRNVEIEKVTVSRIDDTVLAQQLARVDMIKLDIEGGELAALKGAEHTLRQFRPVVLFELNEETSLAAGYTTQDLVRWVQAQGYRLEIIDDYGRTSPLGRELSRLGSFQNVVALPE